MRERHGGEPFSPFWVRWKQNIQTQSQSSSQTYPGSMWANQSTWPAFKAPCRCSTSSPTAVLIATTYCQVGKRSQSGMKLADLAKLEEKWSERGLVVVGVHRYPLLSLFNGCRHKGTRRSFLPVFVCSAKFEHERKDDNVRHAVQRSCCKATHFY